MKNGSESPRHAHSTNGRDSATATGVHRRRKLDRR